MGRKVTTGTSRSSGNINLRVTRDERWEFKAWCTVHRMSQVDAFREAFALLKQKREDAEEDAVNERA